MTRDHWIILTAVLAGLVLLVVGWLLYLVYPLSLP